MGGAPIVQIIYMRMTEAVPPKADYVLIEATSGGRFLANGSVLHTNRVAFFNPSPFGTLDDAIASSKSWAEENNVRVIYVKAGT